MVKPHPNGNGPSYGRRLFPTEAEKRATAAAVAVPKNGKAVYRCKEDCFLDGSLRYAGTEVEFLGWPQKHLHLEPLNDDAKAIVAYIAENWTLERYKLPYRDGVLHLPPKQAIKDVVPV